MTVILAFGCGRIGYEPLVGANRDGGGETGAVSDADGGVQPADVRDGGAAAEVSLAIDAAGMPLDTAVSPDTAPSPDAEIPDASVAPDHAPDPDTAVSPADVAGPGTPDATAACLTGSSFDVFADFEDGTVNSNPGDAHGGTPFLLVGQVPATVTNQAQAFCARRVLALARVGSPGPAVLIQSRWMTEAADGSTRWFDARGYRGLALVMRASTPTEVRLKLPNRDTINTGNDHFQRALSVGSDWFSVSLDWRAFQQTGAGGSTQFPIFDLSQLFAVELSASLPAGATLWVDEIALLR